MPSSDVILRSSPGVATDVYLYSTEEQGTTYFVRPTVYDGTTAYDDGSTYGDVTAYGRGVVNAERDISVSRSAAVTGRGEVAVGTLYNTGAGFTSMRFGVLGRGLSSAQRSITAARSIAVGGEGPTTYDADTTYDAGTNYLERSGGLAEASAALGAVRTASVLGIGISGVSSQITRVVTASVLGIGEIDVQALGPSTHVVSVSVEAVGEVAVDVHVPQPKIVAPVTADVPPSGTDASTFVLLLKTAESQARAALAGSTQPTLADSTHRASLPAPTSAILPGSITAEITTLSPDYSYDETTTYDSSTYYFEPTVSAPVRSTHGPSRTYATVGGPTRAILGP